jgi:hypothetical protein
MLEGGFWEPTAAGIYVVMPPYVYFVDVIYLQNERRKERGRQCGRANQRSLLLEVPFQRVTL